MKISLKKSINFSKLSGDNNLIHTSELYASKFFFKEPILHGVYVAIIALKKFLKIKKNVFIKSIEINYLNFININENFEIKIKKNNIYIYNERSSKIKIKLETKKFDKEFLNKNIKENNSDKLYKDLLFITKVIGSKIIGNGALIFKINLNYDAKNLASNKKIKIRRINNNLKIININYVDKDFEIVCGKAKVLRNNIKKFKIIKKVENIIYEKKFLVFGASGDLASIIINSINKKTNILKFSFRLDKNFSKKVRLINKRIQNCIKRNKPDYILYLCSCKIYHGKNSKNLYNLYNSIYSKIFLNLLNQISKYNLETKIFYPSSIAVKYKNKYKQISDYIEAKEDGETICKKHALKKNIYCARLPQFRSRSNYNILGYYEGENLLKIKKFFNKFILDYS